MDINGIKSLFDTTKGVPIAIEKVLDLTSDIKGLRDMLDDIYRMLPTSGTKSRCTCIIKKINEFIVNKESMQADEEGVDLDGLESLDRTMDPTVLEVTQSENIS